VSWIDTIGRDQAEGPLAELYAAIAKARGGIAEVHRAQSLHPRALRAHLDLYKLVGVDIEAAFEATCGPGRPAVER